MLDALPPSSPAIIRAAEPWETRLRLDLAKRGVPWITRGDIVAEVKRLQGLASRYLKPTVLRPTLDDLGRYGGLTGAFIPGMTGAIAAGEGIPTPFSFVFVNSYGINTSASSHTFEDCDLGAEGSTRVILVASTATGGTATHVSTVIAGVTATDAQTSSNATNGHAQSLRYAAISSGLIGDITVNYSGTKTAGFGIIIFAIYGSSGAHLNSGSSAYGTSNRTLAVTVPAGGAIFAHGGTNSVSSLSNCTWTNATEEEDWAYRSPGLNLHTAASALVSATLTLATNVAANKNIDATAFEPA